ncbi:MAG: hypothetical protein M0032_04235, partial [Actinomycetota bacterium]|nr:hypothetical protein [Actinomycetota bacterium]
MDTTKRLLARRSYKGVVAVTGSVLGVAGLAAGSLSVASGSGPRPPLAMRLAAASAPGPAAADQAALAYVAVHDPGAGTATVLKTEPDVERGVAVYDVRVVAPDGAILVVHVQRSNGVVLGADLAERQTSPTTSTTAATTPPPAVLPQPPAGPTTQPPPAAQPPVPVEAPQPVEAP